MVLKKMLLFVAMIMILVIGSQGFSQSAVIESFDYPATIHGLGTAEAGWGGSWAIDTTAGGTENCAVMAGYVFDYEDLYYSIPDSGNAVQVTKKDAWSQSQRYKRPLAANWPNTAGETYWFSYLLQAKEPLPVGNTYLMLKLYNDGTELLAVGKAGGGPEPPVYTCGSGWTGSAPDISAVEVTSDPVWLVVRIDMSGNAADDSRTFMWVDPDPVVEPDTATADVKRNSNMDAGINTIALEFGGDGSDVQLIFDEISLADSYTGLTNVTSLPELAKYNLPDKFNLSQNYPNPFNPSTKISYVLNKKSRVKLTVFDITGKEIARLVNGYQAAGKQEVVFSAENLPSGIYFYKLQANGQSETRKMMLIR